MRKITHQKMRAMTINELKAYYIYWLYDDIETWAQWSQQLRLILQELYSRDNPHRINYILGSMGLEKDLRRLPPLDTPKQTWQHQYRQARLNSAARSATGTFATNLMINKRRVTFTATVRNYGGLNATRLQIFQTDSPESRAVVARANLHCVFNTIWNNPATFRKSVNAGILRSDRNEFETAGFKLP